MLANITTVTSLLLVPLIFSLERYIKIEKPKKGIYYYMVLTLTVGFSIGSIGMIISICNEVFVPWSYWNFKALLKQAVTYFFITELVVLSSALIFLVKHLLERK